ncbi:MAG TPA: hypothetical protein VG895_03685 [Patescibacteria group bacterium]|nr:hypothetical protein [Patescibacteria group bacterium]
MARTDIPIVLSEYNYTCCGRSGSVGTKESITWDAKNFIDLESQGAIAGGYFTGIDLVGEPEAHIFKLFSKDLGLGNGNSKVYKTTLTNFPNLNATAAINNSGQRVLMFSNSTANNENLNISLNNTGFSGSYTANIYLANLNNDPASVNSTQNINFSNGNSNFN